MSDTFPVLKHFSKEEFKDDYRKIAWESAIMLDAMRDASGHSCVIHVAWEDGGHDFADSAHYGDEIHKATAIDCHFVGMSLLEQWLLAERFPWSGIGLYPYWQSPGLHLDLKSRNGLEGGRWWRDLAGKYQPLDKRFLAMMLLLAEKPVKVSS